MATNLFLRATASDLDTGSITGQVAAIGAPGSTMINRSTDGQNGPIGPDGIVFTDGNGGQELHWFSPSLEAVTISGTITFNVWCGESTTSVNATPQVRVDRISSTGTFISTIINSEMGTEMTSGGSEHVWTAFPTSTTLTGGDRLEITVRANDATALTMAGAGEIMVLYWDGPFNGAGGDTFVGFTETLSQFTPRNPSSDDILNPDVDLAINSWTTDTGGTTNLYQSIDELTASDTDYIQSPGGPTTAQYYETALETHADPASSTGHIVHYRYQKNIAGGVIDLTAALFQGVPGNIVPAATSNIETWPAGWAVIESCTLAQSSAQAKEGTYSLELTKIAGPNSYMNARQTPYTLMPVNPGMTYTSTIWSIAATTGRLISFWLEWYTSAGSGLSGSAQSINNSTTGWVFHTVTAVAPPTAAYARCSIQVNDPVIGEVHYFDVLTLTTPEIARWTHTSLSNSWVTQDQTLTGAQADSITDYSDLRLRFTPNMVTSDQVAVTPSFVAQRASANSNSAVTTVDLVLTGLTVGNYLIIRSAADNSGGGGGARSITLSNLVGTPVDLATDQVFQHNNDPGAASAGTTCNVGITKISATSGTVRMTYAGSVVQACVAEEWSGIHATTPIGSTGSGSGVASTTLGGGAQGMGTTPGTVAVGDVIYGAIATEGPTADTYTQDTDTTGGVAWTSLTKLGTSNGTADTNQTTYAGYKAPTSAASQHYAPTISPARDSAGMWLIIKGIPAPAPTVKAQVSWANFELPSGGVALTRSAAANVGSAAFPTSGAISYGAGDA